MNLDEAISAFRGITEGVKVGDYVTAKDGRSGYVQAVQGGMVSFSHADYDSSENVTLPSEVLTVNPAKRMTEGSRRCPPGFKMVFGVCKRVRGAR